MTATTMTMTATNHDQVNQPAAALWCLWPSWFVAVIAVAVMVMVCGRHGCGRHGRTPLHQPCALKLHTSWTIIVSAISKLMPLNIRELCSNITDVKAVQCTEYISEPRSYNKLRKLGQILRYFVNLALRPLLWLCLAYMYMMTWSFNSLP